MKYKISTETEALRCKVGFEKAIEIIAKAGFDCWDLTLWGLVKMNSETGEMEGCDIPFFQDNYKEYALHLKEVSKKFNITCNQAHAPFPSAIKGMEKLIIRSIEVASIVGAKAIVVHPDNNLNAEENAKMYSRLLPYAHKFNIKIACENMWNWDSIEDHAIPAACSHHLDFLKHIQAVNDPYLVACVDIGHASMKGLNTSPYEMIKTLGSYVQCLHIHDIDLTHDNHQIPFSLSVDFSKMVEALKEINYKGDLTLEAGPYLGPFDKDNLLEGTKNLKNAIERIRQMF